MSKKVSWIPLYDEYCLGIRYMSSVLQEAGHESEIIIFKGVEYISPQEVPPPPQQNDGGYYGFCTFTTKQELDILLDLLREQKPDLVGMSFSSVSFGLAQFITKHIQEELGIKVMWGGVDSTINSNENIKYCDFLCTGEGEFPVLELVNQLDKGIEYPEVESIWVRKSDGDIVRTPTMKLEKNLDNYPFPDFELEHKSVVIHNEVITSPPYPPKSHLYSNFIIMATRGCPFTCTYCCSGHDDVMYSGDRFLRRRSVDNVISELKYRMKTWPWQIERVEFYDDVFPLNKKWHQEFGPRYKTEIALPFFGYTHPNTGDPEILEILADAGLNYLIMGIQSGSQRTLRKYYDRRHPKESTCQTIQNILDSGIKLLVDFIGYNPLELEEDNLETLDLICDLPKPVGIIKINPMAFYDNYKIYHLIHKENILDKMERPKGVHALQAKADPYFVFWEFLHTLAHFEGFSKEHLLNMANDQYLRQHPEILEEMVTNFYNATYLDANPVVNKEEYVHDLGYRLKQIESNKIYQTYQKMKSLVA